MLFALKSTIMAIWAYMNLQCEQQITCFCKLVVKTEGLLTHNLTNWSAKGNNISDGGQKKSIIIWNSNPWLAALSNVGYY